MGSSTTDPKLRVTSVRGFIMDHVRIYLRGFNEASWYQRRWLLSVFLPDVIREGCKCFVMEHEIIGDSLIRVLDSYKLW